MVAIGDHREAALVGEGPAHRSADAASRWPTRSRKVPMFARAQPARSTTACRSTTPGSGVPRRCSSRGTMRAMAACVRRRRAAASSRCREAARAQRADAARRDALRRRPVHEAARVPCACRSLRELAGHEPDADARMPTAAALAAPRGRAATELAARVDVTPALVARHRDAPTACRRTPAVAVARSGSSRDCSTCPTGSPEQDRGRALEAHRRHRS